MIKPLPERLPGPNASPGDIDGFIQNNSFPLVDGNMVTFVFRGAADQVALRHWIYGLPSSIPLNRLGHTDLWYCVLEFPEGSRIEYKFGITRFGHEEWILDPLNRQLARDPFGGNSVVRSPGYEAPEWAVAIDGVPRGTIEPMVIYSKAFGMPRRAGIYLPANYRPYRRYRLLVVHDGEDYVRYSNLAVVLDNLIESLEIPPPVVALSNPGQRLVEYANDERHARHIVYELIPALQARFPLINEPSGRCLMGASFGAVAALSTVWRFPEMFGSLILQSGSFAFTDIGDHRRSPVFDPVVDFMNRFRKAPGKLPSQIFVSCGVYESLIYENRSIVPFLQKHGANVRFSEARDGHNWENWRDRLRDGLSWLFPGPLWVTYM